jgi:hypothetical protein
MGRGWQGIHIDVIGQLLRDKSTSLAALASAGQAGDADRERAHNIATALIRIGDETKGDSTGAAARKLAVAAAIEFEIYPPSAGSVSAMHYRQ